MPPYTHVSTKLRRISEICSRDDAIIARGCGRQAPWNRQDDMKNGLLWKMVDLNRGGSWYPTPLTWMMSHWLDQKFSRQEEDHLNIETVANSWILISFFFKCCHPKGMDLKFIVFKYTYFHTKWCAGIIYNRAATFQYSDGPPLSCVLNQPSHHPVRGVGYHEPPRFRANHFSQQTIFPYQQFVCRYLWTSPEWSIDIYSHASRSCMQPTLNRLFLFGRHMRIRTLKHALVYMHV